jgi:long-chain acyl-CoA synthetase
MSDSSLINTTHMAPDTSAQAFHGDEACFVTHPWERHYEQGVPAHINIPDHPLTWLIDYVTSHYPSHTAFIYYGTKITYAQFSHYANCFAIELHHLGVKKGDRVAISLPNIPQYPFAFYGALKAGAVVVPTNPLYTEREVQYQLADSGARVMVVLDALYPVVRAVRKQTALEHVIVTSAADFLPPLLRTIYPLSQRGTRQPEPHLTHKELHDDPTLHVMHTILEAHSWGKAAALNPSEPVEASDLAALQYTGGTTGLSKGAMLTHRNLLANTVQTRSWFPQAREGEEVMLCAAPFFHSYGLTVCMNVSILLAATMVLVPRFKPKDVLKTIRRYHPTLFPAIPTMYLAIMHEADRRPEDLGSIKFCISGAAPLPAKVQSDFEAITHGKLVEGYGLSEAGTVTHCNPLTDECRNGSIGLPLPGVDAAIVNQETGESVPVGELGEIVVKGPNIMRGYWNREEETKTIFHDGWLRTGDLGKMDEDGYFYMVERAKDMIIASGFKVYPREVEEVLFHHPAVAEAAVTSAPDAYRGETVATFVVLKPGVEASEKTRQELVQYCKQELAPFKVPKIVEFRESLPKSLIGKVIRRELRAKQAVHRPGISQ